MIASALLIACSVSTSRLAIADVHSPTTTVSAPAGPRFDGPFAHAICALAFRYGELTGKWDVASAICQIAQIIDPMD